MLKFNIATPFPKRATHPMPLPPSAKRGLNADFRKHAGMNRSEVPKISAKFLLRNGADHVVYPEKQVAKWTAIRYTSDHIFDYIEIDEQHAIFEVEVPESWVGKSIGELDIRRKFGINILGIKRSGKTDVTITPDTVLSGEITILALGEYKALQKCFRI